MKPEKSGEAQVSGSMSERMRSVQLKNSMLRIVSVIALLFLIVAAANEYFELGWFGGASRIVRSAATLLALIVVVAVMRFLKDEPPRL